MTLSRDEAADALREITQTQQQSTNAYGYQMASPYLIMWGAIWAIGYGMSYVRPQETAHWLVLDVLGIVGCCWIGAHSKPASAANTDWRYGGTLLALFFFICALFSIMPPKTSLQSGAFFPILVGLCYSLIGIWTGGLRMLVAGVVLATLTLVGFFCLPSYFMLWMAVVGGGGLILGGFWLKRI